MDEDAERGVIFTLGLVIGLLVMWLIFTARGRRTAQQVFEAAGDLAEDLAEQAGDLTEQATGAAGDLRDRLL
ncbi:MAG: hypothetical protein ACRDJN_00050 [Chloroflexota bacterium]